MTVLSYQQCLADLREYYESKGYPMSGKDDPIDQSRPAPRALFLNRENNEQARDNWWRVAQPLLTHSGPASNLPDKKDWDLAWMAAMAAHSYVWEGRVEPGR